MMTLTRFERMVKRRGDAVATVFGDRHGCFAALNRRANAVAFALIRRGIGPEDRVAVAYERSDDAVAALLGILKAGAVYLPVDVAQPAARVAKIFSDAAPAAFVASEASRHHCPRAIPQIVVADLDNGPTSDERDPTDRDRVRRLLPAHAAYMLFTSGSTGAPKAVTITHQALRHFVGAIGRCLPLRVNDCQLAMTASTFDISLLEHLVPLCRGVRVVIAPEEVVRDSHAIATLARRESVTSIQATPTAWASLRHELAATTRLLVGGEALSSSLARELLAIGREVWNLYGPTEATIWTSAHRVTAADAERSGVVAIGRPLYGYRVDVRDHALNACSSGELGQLYIVGGALARGYHDRPALTAERFRPDPCGAWGSRMYCTGDIGRIAADGTIEFSGRSDTQVKLRGTRIELGEIEAALESGKGVGRAAVILRQAPSGEPELAAYITTGGGLPADLDALRRDMIATLPRAMVPSTIIALEALPLTASGKVDRGRLKEFDVRGTRASSSVMTPTQEAIAALFKEVLGLPSIGLEEDFFDLGGHSMTAARLLNRVRAQFGCELELDLLLTAGSVMGLAEVVEDVVGGRAPLRPHGQLGVTNTHP